VGTAAILVEPRDRGIPTCAAKGPARYTLAVLRCLEQREAAEMVGISVLGMKSRVQRGRAQLRQMFDECCQIALDARGKITDFTCGCSRSGS
jgi:hypothetical protein